MLGNTAARQQLAGRAVRVCPVTPSSSVTNYNLSKRWRPKSGANEVTGRARKSRTPVQAQAYQQSASRGASAQPLDRQSTTHAEQRNSSSLQLESERRQTAGQLLYARLGSLRAWQQAVAARCRSLTYRRGDQEIASSPFQSLRPPDAVESRPREGCKSCKLASARHLTVRSHAGLQNTAAVYAGCNIAELTASGLQTAQPKPQPRACGLSSPPDRPYSS